MITHEQRPPAPQHTQSPRLVIDTNVWFGAAWNRTPHRLIDLWRTGRFILCLSEPIMSEYQFILNKTPQSRKVLIELLNLIEQSPQTIFCDPTERIELVREDPSDNIFFECATAADADYIISSDRHLKAHDGFRGIKILSAGAYLKLPRNN